MKLLMRSLAGATLALTTFGAAAADTDTPADKRIPANAKDYAGEPWFRVLAYCAAVYTERQDYLKDHGDAAGSGTARDTAVAYLMAASERVQKDRGGSYDDGLKVGGKELENMRWITASRGAGEPGVFEDEAATCARLKTAYDAL